MTTSQRPPSDSSLHHPPQPTANDARTASFVEDERDWRTCPAQAVLSGGRNLRVGLSRWSNPLSKGTLEASTSCADDAHILTIAQRRTCAELRIGSKLVWKGGAPPNEMWLTGPREATWHGSTRGPFDQLRIYFPQALIAECYTALFNRSPCSAVSLLEADSVTDPTLRHLGRAFSTLATYESVAGACFADALSLAFACRMIALHCSGPTRPSVIAPAAKPQLRSVLDYIEEHLAKPIYLAELSGIAGLSRVHFAIQFKAATGLQPYAYILHRRIRRAQELLQKPDATIVNVALDLGFSSQGHFTDAFRKIVGAPPGRWLSEQTRS